MDPEVNMEPYLALKRAQAKIEKRSVKKEPPDSESSFELKVIHPRQIYIVDLMASQYSAWDESAELQSDTKENRFHEIELSHSFRFLLETCSELLDVPGTELYENVCSVASQVTRATMSLKNYYDQIPQQCPTEIKLRDEQTQTEDALFHLLSAPQDKSSISTDHSKKCIPVRPWMLVPENINPEICIPEFCGAWDKKVQTDNKDSYPPLWLLSDCHSQFAEAQNMNHHTDINVSSGSKSQF